MTLDLNSVWRTPTIGIGNTYYLSLRDQRVGINSEAAPGNEIGLARVYDFRLDAGAYDVLNDKSQTRSFTEHCRINKKFFRSYIPVFSSISLFKDLLNVSEHEKIINPYGIGSDFEKLSKHNGKIVNFGSAFSPTYIHYAESKIAGGPVYRYEKNFKGKMIINKNKILDIELKCHVRPMGINIIYDLKKIRDDLLNNSILKSYKFEDELIYDIFDANDFLEYINNKIEKDPLYLINQNSKNILIDKKLLNNGRVKLKDFE